MLACVEPMIVKEPITESRFRAVGLNPAGRPKAQGGPKGGQRVHVLRLIILTWALPWAPTRPNEDSYYVLVPVFRHTLVSNTN